MPHSVLPANLTHAFFNLDTYDESDITLLGPDGGWVFGRYQDFYGEPIKSKASCTYIKIKATFQWDSTAPSMPTSRRRTTSCLPASKTSGSQRSAAPPSTGRSTHSRKHSQTRW